MSDRKSRTFWYLIECLKLTSVTLLCLQVCAIMSLLPSASLADLTCEALLMLSGNVSCKFWTNISWIFITAARLQQLLQAFKRRSFPSTVQPVCSSCSTVSTLEIELIFSLFHFMAITTKCQTLILSHNFPLVDIGKPYFPTISFPRRPLQHTQRTHTSMHKCTGMMFLLFAPGYGHKIIPGNS